MRENMAETEERYVDSAMLTMVVERLYVHKWLALILVLGAEILTIFWLRIQVPLYEISLVLSPSEVLSESPSAQGGGALSNLLKLGKKTDGETAKLLYLLSSVRLVNFVERKTPLIQTIFPNASIKTEGGKSTQSDNRGLFRRAIGQPASPPLSDVDAALWLQSRIRYQEIEHTDLTKVTLTHEDPSAGKELLMTLYQSANELLRLEAFDQSKERVKYLKNILSEVEVTEYQEALVALLAQQEKKLMLLQEGSAFAAQILEAPRASPRPSHPNYMLALVLGPIIGFFIAIMFITLIEWRRGLVNKV